MHIASEFLGARSEASVANPETKLLDRLGGYLRTITGQQGRGQPAPAGAHTAPRRRARRQG